jgi:hypothetical protein
VADEPDGIGHAHCIKPGSSSDYAYTVDRTLSTFPRQLSCRMRAIAMK